MSASRRHRVLVIGANFAGIAACRALGRRADVTVVDPGRWFEWLPNVHELVSGVKTAAMLRTDRRRIVDAQGGRFLRTAVCDLDAQAGTATTSGGRDLHFDACIVAVGGKDQTHGIPGADKHAMAFKNVAECARIGRRVRALARRSARARVVIVGGGLEGVEGLGELLRIYRDDDTMDVTLIDSSKRLMPNTPAALHRRVAEHCERYGVRLVLERRVDRITPKRVMLDDDQHVESDMTIWTGGIRAPDCLEHWELAGEDDGWATVDDCLQSRNFDNVFVAGDAAGLSPELSKQAYHALDMGKAAAENALRMLRNKPLQTFKPSPKPMLIAFGDLDTFLVSGKTVVASTALAAAKEAVFQLTMASIDPPDDLRALSGLTRRARGALRKAIGDGVRWSDVTRLLDTRLLRS